MAAPELRPPRVAIVRGAFDLAGGAERFVQRIVGALASRGVDVTLVSRHWRPEAADALPAGVHLRELDPPHLGRAWRNASFANAVREFVAREPFDIVQSHERIAGLPVYRAGDGVHRQWLDLRRRKHGAFKGWTDRLSATHRAILREEAAMFAHPALRCVICNSEMVRAEIRRHYGVPEGKLAIIRNGVDLHRLVPPGAAARAALRARLGWPEGRTVFLFVGSGFERKGVEAAVRALARLDARGGAMLVVVGRDRARARYEHLAARLGIANAVRFEGPQADVLPYYQAADAFVLPTLYDPQSNAVLEAMACGLPVITTTGCGSAELLDGSSGHVVDALDVPALARAMQDLRDADRARALGQNARRAIEPYSLQRMTDDYLALYARLGVPLGAAA